MKIFLGAETDSLAGSKWFVIQKEFSPLLRSLINNDYGENLKNISIISILLSDKYLEDGGYRERKYYSRKEKSADIRLRLDHKKFIRANEMERREMYFNHILLAIRIAGEKAGPKFDLERLLSDVNAVLKKDLKTEDGL